MTKLEQLIKDLCPDGVEYKTLGEMGEFFGGITGKSKQDFKDGNAKFITYKNVYSNITVDLSTDDKVKIAQNENQRTLQYGDICFTGSSETPDECGFSSVVVEKPTEPTYLNSFCFFYRLNDKEIFDPHFLKYVFRSHDLRLQIGKTASGVTRFNVSKALMKKVKIPIPPLEVQREIVKYLDNFTELMAELTAELTARKKQYEYYRDMLLDFGTVHGGGASDCDWRTLKEIAVKVASGKNKEKNPKGDYPVYGSTGIIAYCDKHEYEKRQILIARVGANAGYVHIADGRYDVSDNTIMLDVSENVLFKYIYYLLVNMKLNKYAKGGGQPLVTAGQIKEIKIPIPPIKEQERIVSILDRFDKLCNDISEGLPAEIEARRKQYEYYRDKLLSFEEVRM